MKSMNNPMKSINTPMKSINTPSNETETTQEGIDRLRMERKTICDQLSRWISKHCHMSAKVRYRAGQDIQDKMGNSGWGPVTFHLTESQQEKYDLSVMLFFSAYNALSRLSIRNAQCSIKDDDVYKIHVYKSDDIDQINFVKENKGNENRYTYDPNELDSKFIHNSIEDLKNVLMRR